MGRKRTQNRCRKKKLNVIFGHSFFETHSPEGGLFFFFFLLNKKVVHVPESSVYNYIYYGKRLQPLCVWPWQKEHDENPATRVIDLGLVGGGGLTKINTITPIRLLLSPGAIDIYQGQTIVSEFPTPRTPKYKTAVAAFVCKSDECENGRTITTVDRDDKSKTEAK